MIRPKARLGTDYQLDPTWYLRADKKIGRPGIIGGDDLSTGDRILVKHWLRDAQHAEELREMWAHEIRQLHSLSGTTDASEVILPMVDAGEDQQSFYLILRLGSRSPLQSVLTNASTSSWLRRIRQRPSRALLWQNLKRIATGLNRLHSQGILHRHLDSWAVFTDGGEEPDFQLGGFEWSLRLSDAEAKKKRHRLIHPGREYYSFIDDWRDLGVLLAGLLAITLTPNKRDIAQDISFLDPAERLLLRTLIHASNFNDIDQQVLLSLIEDAIDACDIEDTTTATELVLACNLSPQASLAEAIARVSDGHAVPGDHESQRRFIEADLSDSPILILRKSTRNKRQYVLQGTHLTYELRKYAHPNSSESTWDIAFCDHESRYITSPQQIINRRPLRAGMLRIETLVDVRRNFNFLRSNARRWDRYLRDAQDGRKSATRRDKYFAALVLLLLIESELCRANVLPVTIDGHLSIGEDVTEIYVIPRRDEQRDALAIALGLEQGAKRMRRLFEDEDVDSDAGWILSETDNSSDEAVERSSWKFVDVQKKGDAQPLYRFQSDAPVPLSTELFLYPVGLEGTDRLMMRHGKALSALRDYDELLGLLDEPRQFLRSTKEEVDENSEFDSLDSAKQAALRHAFTTLPICLVQGPPGVGKTRLVSALAEQQFKKHQSSRLLFTAQSHQTVDHLLAKVASAVGANARANELLIVRCRPREGHTGAQRQYDLWAKTKDLIDDFARSPLVQNLPDAIKATVRSANDAFAQADGPNSQMRGSTKDARAIESLVLRSANLVFATTNAADLERLLEEHAHFDMSLIEEAAKATGVELVSPMLLSHRRVAIGDHKQLPPFGSERRQMLLGDSAGLSDALTGGWPMVAASFRAVGLDETVDWLLGLGEDEFAEVVGLSRAMLTIFQTMVERELDRQKKGLPPIAHRLNIQHRMHPAIASLVASAFYNKDLHSDKVAEQRFLTQTAPITSSVPEQLPNSPVVFIDVPYIQKDLGVELAETYPAYHNPREVELTLKTLELLAPQGTSDSSPSLAVLSPYKEQVRRITQEIDGRADLVDHLKGFMSESGAGIHIGTVDSFQGNEADVVVISLVRNNHRSGLRALGFLRDARRMNVLISRAKWQLIIIGSLEFLETCVGDAGPSDEGPSAFLRKFVDQFRLLESQQLPSGVPAAVRVNAQLLES